MGYAFLEASAKAKIANVATNLGALAVFAPGGHVMVKVGAGDGRGQPRRRLRRRPDGRAGGSGFVRVVFIVVVVAFIVRIGGSVLGAWS